MVSEEEMSEIMRGVPAIGPNNAGVNEAAHLLAEAMKEGVVYDSSEHFHILHLVDPDETCIDGDIDLQDIVLDGHLGQDRQRVRVIMRLEGGSG